MSQQKQSLFEQIFEKLLWRSRLVIVTAVVFAILGAFALFIAGAVETIHTFSYIFAGEATTNTTKLIAGILGSIDLFLIGIFLFIFAFGVYELFISKIDIARQDEGVNILEIESLDELKNKLIKVVIIILIVSFFKAALNFTFSSPIDLLYLAGAILAISICYFLLIASEKK